MRGQSGLIVLVIAIFGSLVPAQLGPTSHSLQWDILAEGGKGEFRGKPVCHPLKYFYGSPFLFDFQGDLYGMKPANIRVATDEFPVGTIQGRKILQIDQRINGGELIMKRLLVQRQDDEFCAIYQQQYPAALVHVTVAKIETISGEQVLETIDANGEHSLNEADWAFDAKGPMLLDLKVIQRALRTILRVGTEARGYGLNIAALCYRSAVWKSNDCNACASAGFVAMKLALRDHHLIVLRKLYDPKGNSNSSHDNASCTP